MSALAGNYRWLPTVVRARQAAEDNAALQVAQARRELAHAETVEVAEARRVAEFTMPDSADSRTFLAAATAGSAAAASSAAASHRVGFARQRVDATVHALTDAARRRQSVEKLSDRLETEADVRSLATAQRVMDDVTVSRFARRAAGLS
jgi:hypothetical protein